jgi:hypothetical protein
MNGAPLLPVPTLREFWAAQGGGLFFFKWMIGAGMQVLFAFAVGVILLRSNWDPDLPSASLFWLLPVCLPPLVLFGFHWRGPAWCFVTIVAYFAAAAVVSTIEWPSSIVAVSLMGAAQSLLLIGVRRRAAIWLVAFPGAYVLCQFIHHWIQAGGLEFTLWRRLISLGVSRLIAHEFASGMMQWTPQIIASAILGTVFVWLMPPADRAAARWVAQAPRLPFSAPRRKYKTHH